MTKEFVFTTKKNNQIRLSAFGYEQLKSAPCVIFVHGFKGFKDWGFWPETGKFFAENGFFVLSFNFSHNGVGIDSTDINEPDKFAENTFSLEVSELNEIIDSCKNHYFGYIDNNKVGLLGHSRGGAVSLFSTAGRKDVDAVAIWSSIAHLDRYSTRQKEKWKKEGFFEVVNSRTKQVMRLNIALLDDIEKNSEGHLNLRNSVMNLRKPLLIVHGEEDLTVKIDEADELFGWADKGLTTLHKIKSTGHTFGIVHPFEGTNRKFDEVLNRTLTFFKSNLFEDHHAGQ
jgi:dipeptidyl aminopeptidase/acylaminoacyl peptidase